MFNASVRGEAQTGAIAAVATATSTKTTHTNQTVTS